MKNQREASPETVPGDCPSDGHKWSPTLCGIIACVKCGTAQMADGRGYVRDCPGHTPATEVGRG